MIEPLQKDDQLLDDIRQCEPGPGYSLWWLGQSGFLIKCSSGCLLLDPYLSDSLTEKYAPTDKPHIRMTKRAVSPSRLDMVDVVSSSHNHTDHLDADTLIPLMESNPRLQMVIPEANRGFVAERLSVRPAWPVGLVDGQSTTVGGFTFHGIAAAHDEVTRDAQGRPLFMGYVVCFDGGSVYHSGDTLWHADLQAQLEPFQIDSALLPINGRLPRRRVAGNLWGQEAAALANDIRASMAVPCHYEMFTFNTEPPDAFVNKCLEIGQPYAVLRCGQRLDRPGVS